ncbi:MAG: hypothetical protein ACRD3M_02300 [Thermoanaerobaculia bacterium]
MNREPKPRFTVYGSRFTLSIRIDGVDVEPSARTSEQFGLTCRTYREGRRLQGAPSQELIERALREERND